MGAQKFPVSSPLGEQLFNWLIAKCGFDIVAVLPDPLAILSPTGTVEDCISYFRHFSNNRLMEQINE